MTDAPASAAPAADPRKALRSTAGVLLGVLFVALYYPGAFLLCCLVAKAAPGGRAAQILLGVLGVLALFPFFLLGKRLTKRLSCGRNAFPAGAFLAADTLLLAIPLCDLLNVERLLALAGGDKALAQQYAKNCAVLIFALVLLAVTWLITVFWRVFKRFRAVSEALERELAAAKAANTDVAAPNAAVSGIAAPGTAAPTAAAQTAVTETSAAGTPADDGAANGSPAIKPAETDERPSENDPEAPRS